MQRISLDNIQVASPCPVAWDGMIGDGRVRFCSQCQQRVYNLAEMPRKQAEALVRQAEGKRVCVRFYRRPDGTVMTRDCPVGLAAVRRRLAWVVGGAAAAILFLLGWGAVLVGARGKDVVSRGGRSFDPIQVIQNWINPQPPMIMGDICPPTPPPPPPPPPDGE